MENFLLRSRNPLNGVFSLEISHSENIQKKEFLAEKFLIKGKSPRIGGLARTFPVQEKISKDWRLDGKVSDLEKNSQNGLLSWTIFFCGQNPQNWYFCSTIFFLNQKCWIWVFSWNYTISAIIKRWTVNQKNFQSKIRWKFQWRGFLVENFSFGEKSVNIGLTWNISNSG